METLNTAPTLANSTTIKWGVLGTALASLCVGAAHFWPEHKDFFLMIAGMLESITIGGVSVGQRRAAGANAAAIQRIGDATGARLPVSK